MGTRSFGGQHLCLPKICWTQNIGVHLELKENLELECGPAQPNLFYVIFLYWETKFVWCPRPLKYKTRLREQLWYWDFYRKFYSTETDCQIFLVKFISNWHFKILWFKRWRLIPRFQNFESSSETKTLMIRKYATDSETHTLLRLIIKQNIFWNEEPD